MKIHYVTLWGENALGRELSYSPAAMAKMKYMISVLHDVTSDICIASFSSGKGKFSGFIFPKTVKLENNVKIRYCATFAASNKYLRLFERVINKIQLFSYLVFTVRKEDIVLIYHERYFLSIVNLVKKMVRRTIVYEVEEIYAHAAQYPESIVQKEIAGLHVADAYVLINDMISSVCNFSSEKPSVVFYGSYQIDEIATEKFNDGKIHLVYAGTLDPQKGGASMAVQAAIYLPENYHLHVLGFGTKSQVQAISDLIVKVNRCSSASVSYDGILSGTEYLTFLRKCQIGLSTQNPEGQYNDTSFPSKVISYMANGLTVVSVKIDVLTASKIGKSINYYTTNDPCAVASALINATIRSPQALQAEISKLDTKFRFDLKNMITRLHNAHNKSN